MTIADVRAAIEAAYAIAGRTPDPAITLQAAIRRRLKEYVGGTVPFWNIIDAPKPGNQFPAITFGTPQTIPRDLTLSRQHATVALDVHVWTGDEAVATAQKLAALVRDALFNIPLFQYPTDDAERAFVDVRYVGTRVMRDRDDQHCHAIVSVEALARWTGGGFA